MAGNPPILTPTSQIVATGVTAIQQALPGSQQALQTGYMSAVPAIMAAHTDLALARVADEVQSARLRTATGSNLRTLVASEFNLSIQPAPQSAYATILLARWQGAFSPGVIKQGFLFRRQGNPNARPIPTQSMSYAVAQTIYVPAGATSALVQAIATGAGAAGNVPTFSANILLPQVSFTVPQVGSTTSFNTFCLASVAQFLSSLPANFVLQFQNSGHFIVTSFLTVPGNSCTITLLNTGAPGNAIQGTNVAADVAWLADATITPTIPLFDTNFTVVHSEAAGGSPGISDVGLRLAARANAVGQYGPTDGALVAGALSQQSVAQYAFFRAGALSYAQGYLADISWASSGIGLYTGASWVDAIAGAISQSSLGFGCRVRWGQVVNQLTSVSATIYLTTTTALAFTQTIDANVRAAIRSYFDTRRDWYTWRPTGLAAAMRAADPNIQQVKNLVISDAISNVPIPQPTITTLPISWQPTVTHYFIGADPSDNTVTNTYAPPI